MRTFKYKGNSIEIYKTAGREVWTAMKNGRWFAVSKVSEEHAEGKAKYLIDQREPAQRGGKREGAGRKPSGREKVWFSIDADWAEVLMGMEANERAALVEGALKNRIPFKKWPKEQQLKWVKEGKYS